MAGELTEDDVAEFRRLTEQHLESTPWTAGCALKVLDERDALRARVAELEADRDGWKRAAESQNKQWSRKCTESTEARARVEELEAVVERVRALIPKWMRWTTSADCACELKRVLPAAKEGA